MPYNEFHHLRRAAIALPPDQLRQLRDELDRRLAELAPAGTSIDAVCPDADPLLGRWRDYADEIDEIVAGSYRKRREATWREFDP
jgi:hypothetical protein